MKTLIQAVAMVLFASSTAQGQQAVQWRVQDGGNGHWYQVVVVPSGLTWEAARTASSMAGGDLASLEGPAEASRCFVWFSREAVPLAWAFQSGSLIFGPWIGGYQMPGSIEPSGGWRWTSGVDFDPTRPPACCNNACGGSSNEDRLHLYFSTSTAETTWNDLPSVVTCGGQIRGYVVEWSADCNTDGIVDYGQILQGQLPDTNTNGIPDGCECSTSPTLPACCAGDLNQDRFVDGADLGILLNAWGACPSTCPADLNRDGFVDGSDLGTLLGRWGGCP